MTEPSPSADFLGESLIFVISQPRAGSTLLQTLLAGHPQIHSAAEPWIMLHPVFALRDDKAIQLPFDAHWAHLALQNFLSESIPAGISAYHSALRAFASTLYGHALDGTGASYFLDKTPRYYYIIPELHDLFPRAKFVFLLRNPLAVLGSIIQTWSGGDLTRLAPNADDLTLAPRLICEGITRLGDDAITVQYESLVTAPEDTVRSLCARLGISFEPGMLTYGERPTLSGVVGDPAGIHQHSAPSVNSLEKWKRLGDNRQALHYARAYLDELGPSLLAQMGYDHAELKSALDAMQPTKPRAVIAWRTALRQPMTRSYFERLNVDRVRAVQHLGSVRGNILWGAGLARRMIRKIIRI